MKKILQLFYLLPGIGILPSDSPSEKLRKRFMNSMGLLMSNGGLMWGGISLYFGLNIPAIIPFSYTILTGFNLTYFHFTKNFKVYRFFQVLMSLLLPFLFQSSLGGLIESGGMMLWSFLALVGAMSVQEIRISVYWLLVYIAISIGMGFIDHEFYSFSVGLEKSVMVWFFVVNITFISTVIFGLMLYYMHSRNKANAELEALSKSLEIKVQDRTADLQLSNNMLNHINEELNATVNQVQEQNRIIEHKNKNITDSLNYAKRIQKAILDNSEKACTKLNDYFIFFKPRDIVSGDFYRFHCEPDDDKFIAVVVDCTGHGVPGAFMSLIGDSLITQIIVDKKVHDPARILKLMNEGVERALKHESNNRRDGMDMAVLVIDRAKKQIEFAGAKLPLVCIRNGQLHELKGSVHPIGGGLDVENKNFVTRKINMEEEGMYYLFTDGFADQFGETTNRKYLTKNFKTFLHSIAHLPSAEQIVRIEQEHLRWKGKLNQTDDMLVVGVKI